MTATSRTRLSRRLLLVDDEESYLHATRRLLEISGHQVDAVLSFAAARPLLDLHRYDAVLLDLRMPEIDGMEALRTIRASDPDTPVLIVTAAPTNDSATEAVELGIHRYLLKPVPIETMLLEVERAATAGALSRLRREAADALQSHTSRSGEFVATAEASPAPIDLNAVFVVLQPIVSLRARRVIGYETLVRSRTEGGRGADDLLARADSPEAARALTRRILRDASSRVSELPMDHTMFVKVHPADLADPALLSGEGGLSIIADRVVFIVSLRARFDRASGVALASYARQLRAYGFRFGVDDIGTGSDGFASVLELEPDFITLDRAYADGIDGDPTRQHLAASMVELSSRLNAAIIAEGVETVSERDTLRALGVDLMRGYFFARPHEELLVPADESYG